MDCKGTNIIAIEKDINGNYLAWFDYERCKAHPKLAHKWFLNYKCVQGHDVCDQMYPSKDCPYCEPKNWECEDCGMISGIMQVN